jgi:anti-anti-sigma factor
MEPVPSPRHCTVDSHRYGNTVFLYVSGEFDLAAAGRFDRTADAQSLGAQSLVVDLSDVTFIDSSGLRALLRLWEQAQADQLDLVVVPGGQQVRHAMALTGVDSILPFAEERPPLPAGIARGW